MAKIKKDQFWRHKKTGGVYIITGFCVHEATEEIMVLYTEEDADDGWVEYSWARNQDEFLDGRFEKLNVREKSDADE